MLDFLLRVYILATYQPSEVGGYFACLSERLRVRSPSHPFGVGSSKGRALYTASNFLAVLSCFLSSLVRLRVTSLRAINEFRTNTLTIFLGGPYV